MGDRHLSGFFNCHYPIAALDPGHMPAAHLEKESASVVFLGQFNPAIFQPAWFAAKALLSATDVDAGRIQVIHPRLSTFSAGGFDIQVLQERFTASVEQSIDQVRLRDLSASVFDILTETPISRMGINWVFVHRIETEDAWHEVGHRLAPKAIWTGILNTPGMRSVTMQGKRPTGPTGAVNVKVEPVDSGPGAYALMIEINHDYTQPRAGSNEPADYFVKILRSEWDRLKGETSQLVRELLDRTLSEKEK